MTLLPVDALLAAVRRSRGRLHLVGIGGVGLSAVARLLLDRGFLVSGSDLEDNAATRALRDRGVSVQTGHDDAAVRDAAAVVASPAVPSLNRELAAARAARIPVFVRAGMLAALVRSRRKICVAGSHGKTTTTAMTAFLLREAGIDAGFAVGGYAPALGDVNAHSGRDALFVVETCEAFGALEVFDPEIVVVTNVDDDHVEHYGGVEALREAFTRLVDRRPAGGTAILCGDDPGVQALLGRVRGPVVTYGLAEGNDLRARLETTGPAGSTFGVLRGTTRLGEARVVLPGEHVVRNALASLAAALAAGVDFDRAASSLARFTGVRRRWELKGEANGIRVFEDFAHHPAEIAATLIVARQACGRGGRVIAAFEPQLQSRTALYSERFVDALLAADAVFAAPVAGPGERSVDGAGSDAIVERLVRHRASAFLCRDLSDLSVRISEFARPADLVVALGGGAIGEAAERVLEHVRTRLTRRRLPVEPGRHPAPSRLLQHGFEARAARSPDAICLRTESSVCSYGQLERDANRVARFLLRGGLGPDDLVAVSMEKSFRFLAVILGILKAGGAYLPVDPRMAAGRWGRLLELSGARRVLAGGDLIADLGGTRNDALDVDDAWTEVLGEPDTRPPVATSPRDLAYAILTSGSTGEPKVVGVEHRNVANLLDYATRELLDEEDLRSVPFIDSIGFDSSVQQIFATLTHGGTLLLRDLAKLIHSPADVPITSVGTTPSLLATWLDAGTLPESVRVVGLGGEVIPPLLLERVRRLGHVRKVLNYYGPTETTIYSTVAWLVDPRRPEARASGGALAGAGRNLGRPIQGTRVYLLDADRRPVPEGAEGEITIGGAGVARGYLGAPELTAERFGPDLLADEPGERWYRTGDRGRLLPDGSLEFLGRLDGQMKIRGVRLDSEEVEAHLTACPGVREAAVSLRSGPAGGELLVAALVADPDVDLRRLRTFLRPRLPAILVPAGLVRLERLPLTPYGKVDRQALKDLGEPEWFRNPSHVSPRTDLERELVVIWKDLLQREEIGVEDSFFDLGGDSLLWVRLQTEVQRALGVEVPPDWGPEPGTIADLAGRLQASSGREAAPPRPEPAIEPILRQELQYLAAWRGERTRPDALIVTRNASGTRTGLFWCFQGFEELKELARSLGPDQPIHGMRSGYLVMEYTEENVKDLAKRYADEMQALQPEGPLWVGGNCQGGTIALAAALCLREAGRVVSKLFLMEQGRFPPYDGPVALIFGHESHFNPVGRLMDPESQFRASYPAGYTLDVIPGAHGQFFGPPNVDRLASVLGKHLAGKGSPQEEGGGGAVEGLS